MVGYWVGISRQFSKLGRSVALLAVMVLLAFSAHAKADSVSNAVLNHKGGLWAAYYFGSLSGFNPSGSVPLILNDSSTIEIDDPVGDAYYDSSLDLEIDLSNGVPTGGHLVETTGDYFSSADASQNYNVTPATLFSSSIIRGFGQIPSTTGTNFWFAFQNGSNPKDLIGGTIDSADVKTFATVVPLPAAAGTGALILAISAIWGFFRKQPLSAP